MTLIDSIYFNWYSTSPHYLVAVVGDILMMIPAGGAWCCCCLLTRSIFNNAAKMSAVAAPESINQSAAF
jgi:hypothetical protein